MNIMASNRTLIVAEESCDKLANKMSVESVRILVQAVSHWCATELMPLTKTTGKPHRSRHHPAEVGW